MKCSHFGTSYFLNWGTNSIKTIKFHNTRLLQKLKPLTILEKIKTSNMIEETGCMHEKPHIPTADLHVKILLSYTFLRLTLFKNHNP